MKTLVTGATGFVGSAVARLLLARGEVVRTLTRPGSDATNVTGIDVEVVHGDLRDKDSLREACVGCDTLYHLAADYRLWARDPSDIYQSNVVGTRNLMRAALQRGVSRIVFTSSVATLGVQQDGTPSNEDVPVTVDDMTGHYKRSKFLAEQIVTEMIAADGLPAVIVNPSTPIGPRDVKPTPTGRIVRDAMRGRMPAYVDTGLNIVHVDDVAAGHLLAFDKGEIGRRYILGGEDMSLREILATVAEICGRPAPKVRLPRRALYPLAWAWECWARLTNGPEPQATMDGLRMAAKKMYFDSSRARVELGYTSRPAREALGDAVNWFKYREVKAKNA